MNRPVSGEIVLTAPERQALADGKLYIATRTRAGESRAVLNVPAASATRPRP